MMVMVGILSNTGAITLPSFLTRKAGDRFDRRDFAFQTAVLSAFLDNVTTMLLWTPVTIQLASA